MNLSEQCLQRMPENRKNLRCPLLKPLLVLINTIQNKSFSGALNFQTYANGRPIKVLNRI